MQWCMGFGQCWGNTIVSCETSHKPKIKFSEKIAKCKPQATKSFSVQQFFKNAAEVWASSPHLRSKLDFAVCFPSCNCIFENGSIQTKLYHENQGCKFRQGNGAIAACWQAKAGVDPPFAGRERPFSLRAGFSEKFSVPTVPPEQLEHICFPIRLHKAVRSCSPRLEKLSLFSPPPPCAKSMARGFRCLLAAIRATRPEPRQHF